MTKALILGCSHAAGAEIYKDPDLLISDDHKKTYGAQNSFPALIAQSLNHVPMNHAISGGSNDAIFRIFESQLESLSTNDIVIACWTGFDRGEVWYTKENRWLPIATNINVNQIQSDPVLLQGQPIGSIITDSKFFEEYAKIWNIMEANLPRGRLNKLKNILALNSLASMYDIKVINIDSFYPVQNFKWPSGIFWPVNISFCDWCNQQQFYRTDWGHYFRPAHQAYADLVLKTLSNCANW
jgi:hypothetical protein